MASTLPSFTSKPDSSALAALYRRVRQASLSLAAPLMAEDQVVQTIPEVSPTKWHLAHVTWFFERFCLLEHALGDQPFHRVVDARSKSVDLSDRRPAQQPSVGPPVHLSYRVVVGIEKVVVAFVDGLITGRVL